VQVLISSRHLPVNPELEAATREKINRLDRYLAGLDRAEVHFYEERNPRIADRDVCEIRIEGKGNHLRCRSAGPDALTAVDKAIAKLERQLGKQKTKLVDRHHGNQSRTDKHAEAPTVNVPDADDIRFVRQKQFASSPMTAVDAVQAMELLEHDFFLFTNAETGAASVVYRRLEHEA
jgi:putative sigma-54 modulation protein